MKRAEFIKKNKYPVTFLAFENIYGLQGMEESGHRTNFTLVTGKNIVELIADFCIKNKIDKKRILISTDNETGKVYFSYQSVIYFIPLETNFNPGDKEDFFKVMDFSKASCSPFFDGVVPIRHENGIMIKEDE